MTVPAALGFRVHSGWAVLVAVSGPWRDPSMLDRRRIEIVNSESLGGVQPYHAAAQLDLGEADKLVRASAVRATLMAIEAIGTILDRLRAEGYIVRECGILLASGRPLTDLAVTLKSMP